MPGLIIYHQTINSVSLNVKSAHWEIGKRRDTSMMACKVIGDGFEQLDKMDESVQL